MSVERKGESGSTLPFTRPGRITRAHVVRVAMASRKLRQPRLTGRADRLGKEGSSRAKRAALQARSTSTGIKAVLPVAGALTCEILRNSLTISALHRSHNLTQF
jgi:hypothetical protein